MEYLVYLAGPIAGLTYRDSTDWRKKAFTALQYPITTLSPMRYKEALKDEVHIQDAYEHLPLSSRSGLTARDRFDVQRCDLVLFNFLGASKASVGSCIELGWADAWRKPVVIAMEPDNPHYHAMVREIAGFVVPTLDEALDIVEKVLLP